MDTSQYENIGLNLGPNANLYLRHRQAEYSFIMGEMKQKPYLHK